MPISRRKSRSRRRSGKKSRRRSPGKARSRFRSVRSVDNSSIRKVEDLIRKIEERKVAGNGKGTLKGTKRKNEEYEIKEFKNFLNAVVAIKSEDPKYSTPFGLRVPWRSIVEFYRRIGYFDPLILFELNKNIRKLIIVGFDKDDSFELLHVDGWEPKEEGSNLVFIFDENKLTTYLNELEKKLKRDHKKDNQEMIRRIKTNEEKKQTISTMSDPIKEFKNYHEAVVAIKSENPEYSRPFVLRVPWRSVVESGESFDTESGKYFDPALLFKLNKNIRGLIMVDFNFDYDQNSFSILDVKTYEPYIENNNLVFEFDENKNVTFFENFGKYF